MGRAIALAALLCMTTVAMAAEHPGLVVEGGGHRCQRWLEERAKPASSLGFGLERWVRGFTLGRKIAFDNDDGNVSEPPTYLMGVTNDDVLSRVDVYCRIHRSNFLLQAILEVNADLMSEHGDRILRSLGKR